jgi:hypothetical protein
MENGWRMSDQASRKFALRTARPPTESSTSHIRRAYIRVTRFSQEGQERHRDAKAGTRPRTQALQRACERATQELIKS